MKIIIKLILSLHREIINTKYSQKIKLRFKSVINENKFRTREFILYVNVL